MKKTINTLSILLLLFCSSSCGVFSKFAKHAHHEAHHVDSSSSNVSITSEVTVKGDSIIHIPGSSLQVTMPFTFDTLCTDQLDSIVTDQVKVYLRPIYQLNTNGLKSIKGMQVKAITLPKTVKPGFAITQRNTINAEAHTSTLKDSIGIEQQTIKKRDNRLVGYTTIIICISLLCVGIFIAKKSKLKF
jgi:hypothetical protein